MTQKLHKFLDDNPWARWSALVLLATAMFFGYIFVDILSPLESELPTSALGWSATDYGNYTGAETFLNVFVFFLIFAGIILDKMGVRFTSILSGVVMLAGGAMVYFSSTDTFISCGLKATFDGWLNIPDAWWNFTPFVEGMPASAKFAAIGFMIFGCGVEMAGITVSRGIVKWFTGKEMALAMGIEMAIARIGVAVAFVLGPFLAAEHTGVFSAETGMEIINYDMSKPLAFAALLLCIGLICFIAYSVMDYKLEKQKGNTEEKDDPFKISDLKYIFTSKVFWIVSMLCVLYYSAIFPFQNYASGMLRSSLGITPDEASDIFFWFPLGAAAITPFLGAYLDKKGKGATMLIFGSILMIVCHGIFALVLPVVQSKLLAYAAIVLLGISFSLVPASLWPSVPKLVDKKVIGSAYAVIFWIQNIGLYGFRKGIGSLLDAVNEGVADRMNYDYTIPMLVFVGFVVAALFFSLWLKVIDKKNNYHLEEPNM